MSAVETGIRSRVPYTEYQGLTGINISRLKELKRSALHYQYRLANPLMSDSLTLGTAAHVATLEPERFDTQFCIWNRRGESGNLCPRKGQFWDKFVAGHPGQSVLTEKEHDKALALAAAVRADACAMRYLESGEPEVTMQWVLTSESMLRQPVEVECRGRVDWLTRIDGAPYLIGLKTARDCRAFQFGSQAARLGYHLQWSWYHQGYKAITGLAPRMKEIVVESAPPYDVAVYDITEDVLLQGQAEYEGLLRHLIECEQRKEWLGTANGMEQILTLPTWAYDALDDLSDLGLVGETSN